MQLGTLPGSEAYGLHRLFRASRPPSFTMTPCAFFLFVLFLTYIVESTQAQDAGTQSSFTINSLTLTIEPAKTVWRDANVTLRCRAQVIYKPRFTPIYQYSIYKNKALVETNKIDDRKEFLHTIGGARVSDSGAYKCVLTIQGKTEESSTEDLTVHGLQTPALTVSKEVVNEGEEVLASCKADGESGSFLFFFTANGKEIHEASASNAVQTKLPSNTAGDLVVTCHYKIKLMKEMVTSNISNQVNIKINELPITVSIGVSPSTNVIEGDNVSIACRVNGDLRDSSSLLLFSGDRILSSGGMVANHSMMVLAKDSGMYECKFEMGKVRKSATTNVTVEELFSQPVLSMDPPEVFEKEKFEVTCRSDRFSPRRISQGDVKYSIYRDGELLTLGSFSGRHTVVAGAATDGNYTCSAQARMITKPSTTTAFSAKVLVSRPVIWAEDTVVLGKQFHLRCHSENGSLPINYTLLRDGRPVSYVSVWQRAEKAQFSSVIYKEQEIHDFSCKAQNNGPASVVVGDSLSAVVVVPLGKPLLTVLPTPADIAEGHDVILICGTPHGSAPISFKWYRQGSSRPLDTQTTYNSSAHHTVPAVGREHSGTYYCKALNNASCESSDGVFIEVKMAAWKKGTIGILCLLVVAVLVVLCYIRYKAKRGKRATAAELSVKPASPNSDVTLRVSLTHDSAAYSAPKGVDGGGTSVWSERPSTSESSDHSVDHSVSADSPNAPDVEYTEVVHPPPADPTRVPLRKGTDTVYSELQTSQQGAPDQGDGSVEYAELNHDLPEPAD